MEVSEYLVGSPAFKAGGTGDPRTAGSIPVHLRCYSPQGSIRPFGPRLALRLPTKDLCHIWHPTGAKRGTNLGAGGDL